MMVVFYKSFKEIQMSLCHLLLFQNFGKIPLIDCSLMEEPNSEIVNCDDDSKSAVAYSMPLLLR